MLRCFEEVEADENYGRDDDDEQGDIDDLGQRSESSDTKQEFEDDAGYYVPIASSRDAVFTGKENGLSAVLQKMLEHVVQIFSYEKSKMAPLDIWLCLFDEEIIVDCTNIKIHSIC